MIKWFLESKAGYYIRVGGATIGGLVAIYGFSVTAVSAVDEMIDNRVKQALEADLEALRDGSRVNNTSIQKMRAEQIRESNELKRELDQTQQQLDSTQEKLDSIIKILIQNNSSLNRIESR